MTDVTVADVAIAAPARDVWQALRDPAQIRQWHGWEYEGLDGEIAMIYLDDVTASAEALTLDTHGGWRIELEPRGAATAVRVLRGDAVLPEQASMTDAVDAGWRTFAEQLRFYLERHPGELRRTVTINRELPLPAGEAWYATDRQAGVVRDDGTLVIVADGRTIASVYGADDAAVERLRASLEG
jgi:uncharacterized protein YndB with AHSA1/START domain